VDTAEEFEVGDTVTAFNWTKWLEANKERATERFYFSLTGVADGTTDVEIPIASFQARKRTAEATYLSVVIKDYGNYAAAVAARPNGDMVIELAYVLDGEESIREEILRAELEDIALYEGPESRSIVLTGHKTQTFAGQITTLENPIYKATVNARLIYRFAKFDPYLNPGDTCVVGDDSFTVDYVIYMASGTIGGAAYKTMEVRE